MGVILPLTTSKETPKKRTQIRVKEIIIQMGDRQFIVMLYMYGIISIMFITFWDFLMTEQIFLSPQVKGSKIISNKLVYTSCLTSCQTA